MRSIEPTEQDDSKDQILRLLSEAEAALAPGTSLEQVQEALASCNRAEALARARLPDENAQKLEAMAFGLSPDLAYLAMSDSDVDAREWITRVIGLRQRLSQQAFDCQSDTQAETGQDMLPETHDCSLRDRFFSLYQAAAAEQEAEDDSRHLEETIDRWDKVITFGRSLDLRDAYIAAALAAAFTSKASALQNVGTLVDLSTRVALCDDAIELLKELDTYNPLCRRVLASALNVKGDALKSLGTPVDLRAAIEVFNEAVDLFHGVNLSNPDDLINVAAALTTKGDAQRELGAPADLRAALESHKRAISLVEGDDIHERYPQGAVLPLLAESYASKGRTLESLGSFADLTAALEANERAIDIYKVIDPKVTRYRLSIAEAWKQKGQVLTDLSTPPNLEGALSAFDKAITLHQGLDLEIPKNRISLAATRSNKVFALLRQNNVSALNDAVAESREALNFLPDVLTAANRTAAKVKANIYRNLSTTLRRLDRITEAAHVAEQGLASLKEREKNGDLALREKREELYAQTLEFSLLAGQHPILPKLALEHLDPEVSGSAPASEAMHRAAMDVLRRALTEVLIMPQSAALQADYRAAFQRLAAIRERWFGGTAAAAALRARDAELRGDPVEARRIIDAYLEARPRDPEGWRALAEHFRRRGDPDGEEDALLELARRLVYAGPPPENGAEAVAQIGAAFLQLRFARKGLPLIDGPSVKATLDELDGIADQWHSELIRDFPDKILKPSQYDPAPLDGQCQIAWRDALKKPLDTAWNDVKAELARLRVKLIAAHDAETRKAALEEAGHAADNLLRTAIALIPQDWRGFVEGLIHAWQEVVGSLLEGEPDTADPLADDQRAAEVAEALRRALIGITARLDAAALAESTAEVEQYLGRTWAELLTDTERRLLAAAHRLKGSADTSRYAGLELGIALETALIERCINPLSDRADEYGDSFPEINAKDSNDPEARVLAYLRQNKPLMLGPMVALYNRALKHWDGPLSGLAGQLRALLRTWPQADSLPGAVDTQQKARRRSLQRILDVRNQCSHRGSPPSPDDIEEVWRHAIEDPEDAFFVVLGRAHDLA